MSVCVSSKYYDFEEKQRIFILCITDNYNAKLKCKNCIMVKFTGTSLFKGMYQIRMRRWCKAEIYTCETDIVIQHINNCTLLNQLWGQIRSQM